MQLCVCAPVQSKCVRTDLNMREGNLARWLSLEYTQSVQLLSVTFWEIHENIISLLCLCAKYEARASSWLALL